MENPYLLLIDSCLEKLSIKYNTPFKYELVKKGASYYVFSIFQKDDPIYTKEILTVSVIDDFIYNEILTEFFIGGIERIFMQRENAKKLFPKDHAKLKEKDLTLIKGNW